MAEPFFITTPIYCPNDVPHIGHSYTSVATDFIAHRRLRGGQVLFLDRSRGRPLSGRVLHNYTYR